MSGPRETAALLAGAAKIDIAPPLEVGILMSSARRESALFQSVRKPLMARALFLRHNKTDAILISLDLLGLAQKAVGTWPRFIARIAAAAGVKPEQLIIASTHTHNAPETLDLTDLHRTAPFRRWMREFPALLAAAIIAARNSLRPATASWSTDPGANLTLHRRILTTHGIVLSNVPPDPKIVLRQGGPKDETVRIVAFRDHQQKPIATLVNAVCHPVHEMCQPQISPDYPGEMAARIERQSPGSICLFLNGAAGNINPKCVSDGPAGSIAHGEKLAACVTRALKTLRPIPPDRLQVARTRIPLPTRTRTGKPSAKTLTLELSALRLGSLACVFLPGEPFVETALNLLADSPFPCTLIAGYAAEWTGYLPLRQAFAEGGYETGPGDWSRLRTGAAERVEGAARRLLERLTRAGGSVASDAAKS